MTHDMRHCSCRHQHTRFDFWSAVVFFVLLMAAVALLV